MLQVPCMDSTQSGQVEWEPEDDIVRAYSPVHNASEDYEEQLTPVDLDSVMEAIIAPVETSEATSLPSQPIEEEFTVPLYDGASSTLCVSLLIIMSFVIKHGLTDCALQDLLNIICLHCPLPNFCATSVYSFKKFFKGSRILLRRNYYCSTCKTALSSEFASTCPNPACKKESSSRSSL